METFCFEPWEGNENERQVCIPRGELFRSLMDNCFLRSDFVTFSKYPWRGQKAQMECELEPYLQKTFPVTRWFCYTLPREYPRLILLYPASKDVKNILFSFYQDMFMAFPQREGEEGGSADSKGKYCYALSDLCFFHGTKMFWGTVSHEWICMTAPPDDLFQDSLPMPERWIPRPGLESEFLDLKEILR